MVINTINEEMSFCDYYSQWVDVYKEGAIREVTMKKYKLTQAWLRKLIPDLKLSEFDRVSYQKLINGYAARIQFVSATLVFGLAAFDCSLAISSSHTSLGVL